VPGWWQARQRLFADAAADQMFDALFVHEVGPRPGGDKVRHSHIVLLGDQMQRARRKTCSPQPN
jgi:acyl dehydratase